MKSIYILPLLFLFVYVSSAQTVTIKNHQLVIQINERLQTMVNTASAAKLTSHYSPSEYLVTKYYKADDFNITKKTISAVNDKAGSGTLYKIHGIDKLHAFEKIVQIKTYQAFPDVAYFTVQYVNHSKKNTTVLKWVNNSYEIIPSKDTTKFWSFMGSSNADRRDWIQKVNPGFYQKNYMGMNAADYGGGIPIIDIWRKDAGIAIGHTETVPRLVSIPVDYDTYANTSAIHVEYEYVEPFILNINDTLTTYETFVSVHQKDCFSTLSLFSNYMQTKGIKPADTEPAAFEPVWCAWGYERDFTVQQILNTLPKVKELGIKWAGLDDGFQQAEGDWQTNKERFPNGDADMIAFVDSIHANGMKAILWWAPLAADPRSEILKQDPNLMLMQKDGSPQYITWWDAYMMSPSYKGTIRTTKETVQLFMQDWGFDALKLDGQHMNACAPDYHDAHTLEYPEQSCEQMPQLFKTLFETARKIKPNAVIEFCPCGDCISFYHMPYTNQFVASDPLSSWQVRLKGKVYKALMPATAYFADHVELTDGKQDFASQIGIGAVPATKFVWPATGVASKDENLLTPEKEILFKKWLGIYNEKMLSKATYRGDLYDIGYDYPETHCIQKNDAIYYAFYAPHFSGNVQLRGLSPAKKYTVYDYFNQKILTTITGDKPMLHTSFDKFLLIEVKEEK